MSGPDFDGAPLAFDPPAAPPRTFFRPWVTWLSTVLVAGLITHLYVLVPGGPLDHLQRPEDSLERLKERERDGRGAPRQAPEGERRERAQLSGQEGRTHGATDCTE